MPGLEGINADDIPVSLLQHRLEDMTPHESSSACDKYSHVELPG